MKFAAELAQLHAARLISVFIQPEPSLTTAQWFARGQGLRDVVDLQQKQLDGLEARHRKSFEDLARRHGIRSEWRSLSHFNTEVGVHAYYADLVVIARPEPAVHTGAPPGLAESLVLSSGRPILLYPPGGTASRIQRIVLAWNATRESARAASGAVPLLARAESVEVLVVDDKRHPHGQEPGTDIARRRATGRMWKSGVLRPKDTTSVASCCRRPRPFAPISSLWAPMAIPKSASGCLVASHGRSCMRPLFRS